MKKVKRILVILLSVTAIMSSFTLSGVAEEATTRYTACEVGPGPCRLGCIPKNNGIPYHRRGCVLCESVWYPRSDHYVVNCRYK